MTTKEYLSQALYLKNMILRIEDEILQIRSRAESARPINYDKLDIQTSPELDVLGAYVIRLEEVEAQERVLLLKYHTIYANIQTQILSIEPELYRQILLMRYLDGRTLNQIADILGYSVEYIRNCHGKSLQTFSDKYNVHNQ